MKYSKHKSGLYRTKVYLGVDETGKPKYKYLYAKTEPELDKKVFQIKKDLEKGLDVTRSVTFGEVVDGFLEFRERTLSESDYKTLESRLSVFSSLNHIPIANIRKNDLQRIIDEVAAKNNRTGKPSSKRTVQRYITAVVKVFENAIENRIIDYNPAKYLTVPHGLDVNERRALTDQERKWIEDTPHRAQLPAMLMIYSGLRKGEATALTWADVNLDEATITVNKSYDFKTCTLKKPKTKSGIRVVNIPQKLVDYLRKQERTCDYVVHTADNRRMTYSGWRAVWDSYILTLDLKYGTGKKGNKFNPEKHVLTIEPFTIHECRHTFCTLMYLAGVDILTAQQQMGHADVKTTLSIYSHLDAKYKKKNVSKLDTFLSS